MALNRKLAALALGIIALGGLPTLAEEVVPQSQATITQAPGQALTAAEVLAKIDEARAKAISEIRSGKGKVAVHRSTADGNQHELKSTQTSVDLAFSGDKFAVRISGTDGIRGCSYDGKAHRFAEQGKTPTTASSAELGIAWTYTRFIKLAGIAYPDIRDILLKSQHDPAQILVAGREIVDGSECICLESKSSVSEPGKPQRTDIWRFYIDPANGFALRRTQRYDEGRYFAKLDMHLQEDVRLRQYGDILLPESMSLEQYAADKQTGKRYVAFREVWTYDPDFAINVPVAQSELELPEAPTTRPLPPSVAIPCPGRIIATRVGIDIATPVGTPVRAVADGKVIEAGWHGAYGNLVRIDHGKGVTTLYSHCSKLSVKKGAKVRRGDIIALSGSTGFSTGPHLSFQMGINGKPATPPELIRAMKLAAARQARSRSRK